MVRPRRTRIYNGGYRKWLVEDACVICVSRSSYFISTISPRAPFATSRSVSILNVTITFIPTANSTTFGRPPRSSLLDFALFVFFAIENCSGRVTTHPCTLSYAQQINIGTPLCLQCSRSIFAFHCRRTSKQVFSYIFPIQKISSINLFAASDLFPSIMQYYPSLICV